MGEHTVLVIGTATSGVNLRVLTDRATASRQVLLRFSEIGRSWGAYLDAAHVAELVACLQSCLASMTDEPSAAPGMTIHGDVLADLVAEAAPDDMTVEAARALAERVLVLAHQAGITVLRGQHSVPWTPPERAAETEKHGFRAGSSFGPAVKPADSVVHAEIVEPWNRSPLEHFREAERQSQLAYEALVAVMRSPTADAIERTLAEHHTQLGLLHAHLAAAAQQVPELAQPQPGGGAG